MGMKGDFTDAEQDVLTPRQSSVDGLPSSINLGKIWETQISFVGYSAGKSPV